MAVEQDTTAAKFVGSEYSMFFCFLKYYILSSSYFYSRCNAEALGLSKIVRQPQCQEFLET